MDQPKWNTAERTLIFRAVATLAIYAVALLVLWCVAAVLGWANSAVIRSILVRLAAATVCIVLVELAKRTARDVLALRALVKGFCGVLSASLAVTVLIWLTSCREQGHAGTVLACIDGNFAVALAGLLLPIESSKQE